MRRSKIIKRANHAALAGSVLLAGSLACGNAAAGGLLLYEVGTEDIGLAAAGYAARAQDASTVLTNPAGMTRLDGNQVQLGGQMLYSTIKFSTAAGTSTALGGDNGGKPVGDNGLFPGGSAFYTYSVSRDLKLGFGMAGNFGNSLKYDDNWVGRYYVQQATLVGMSLLPSIAFRVSDTVSLGASVNAMYGYLKSVVGVNNVLDNRPDGKLVMRDTKWGWGGNLGILYEPTPTTRFGLTYSSQVKLDFSPQAQFSGTGPVLTALLNARGLNGANVNLGVTVPQQVMGSAFHTINDRLTIMGNLGWQQWSKFGEIEVSVADVNNPSLTTSIPFDNTWHAAIGAQYRLSEPWRLNFGVAYDSAFQAGNVSPILPTNQGYRFGFGAQNVVDKSFSWGVAGEYIYGGTADVNKQALLPVALGGRGNLVGSYNNESIYFLSVNASWKF